MRILKYLFLLLLLAAFAMSMFFATQRGNYDVVRSRIINSQRATLYNYINDYKNWEYFYNPPVNETKTDYIFSKNTVGKGASFSWENEDDSGSFTTTDTKENKTITQKIVFNNSESEVYWTFKDTLGKTKVTWRSKGVMPFVFKIYTMLNGGPDKILGKMYEKSLATIDNSLHKEISTYTIVVNGQVTKMGNYYAYYPINSKISNITKNFRAILPKIDKFLQKNNIKSKGQPYILFNKYDTTNDFTNFWVCIDLKEEFITGPESEVLTGKSEAFQAVKATLTGDYSHLNETYSKIEKYMLQKGIKQDFSQPFIELYLKSLANEKKSSLWKTVIYIPILIPKKVEYPTYIPKAKTEKTIISPVSDIKLGKKSPNDIEKPIAIPDLNRPQ
jgi:hypothetical protein